MSERSYILAYVIGFHCIFVVLFFAQQLAPLGNGSSVSTSNSQQIRHIPVDVKSLGKKKVVPPKPTKSKEIVSTQTQQQSPAETAALQFDEFLANQVTLLSNRKLEREMEFVKTHAFPDHSTVDIGTLN